MPDAPAPARPWSQREMALVYLGYKRDPASAPPTPEERSDFKIRRGVALTLALILLVVIGLLAGPLAVVGVSLASALWWAWASRADRRRDQQLAARHRDR